MQNIEPGIYRHWKGNLYLVQCLAFDRNEPTNLEKGLVIYHPLYPVENQGARYGTPQEMFEQVTREGYTGPRFVKIMDWKIEDTTFPGSQRFVTFGSYTYSFKVENVIFDEKEGVVLVCFELNCKKYQEPLSRTRTHHF